MANVDDVMKDIASRVEQGASTRAVFGDPVEQGDRTVIPVAKVRWAGGGGGGAGTAQGDAGEGAGMGMALKGDPIGFIEMGPAGARFERIPDPSLPIKVALVSVLVTVVLLRGWRKIRKIRRR